MKPHSVLPLDFPRLDLRPLLSSLATRCRAALLHGHPTRTHQQQVWCGGSVHWQDVATRATPARFHTSARIKGVKLILLAVIAAAAGIATSHAQYSIYLETENQAIKGEATGGKTEGMWQLTSFSHAITTPPPSSSSGSISSEDPIFHDIAIGKFLDSASVQTLLAVATGGQLNKIFIRFVENATGKEFYVVTLETVTITSVSQSASTGDRPAESVSFAFKKITWKYGSIEKSYDLATRTTE